MPTILVIEDEPDIRCLLVEILEATGFHSIEAETGDRAIGMIGDQRPSLIVTDINLPGALNGIGVAQQARQALPSVPILFISGRPAMLHEAGVVRTPAAYLAKPFSLGAFVRQVETLLLQQSCSPANASAP